jgi:hypothetical protein
LYSHMNNLWTIRRNWPLLVICACVCAVTAAEDVTEHEPSPEIGNATEIGPELAATEDAKLEPGASERPSSQAEPGEAPPAAPVSDAWADVNQVLRILGEEHVVDVDDPTIHQRVIEAILESIGRGAALAPPSMGATPADEPPANLKPITLNKVFAFFVVDGVTPAVAKGLVAALDEVKSSTFEGVVLDLRGTAGDCFEGALAIAESFMALDCPAALLVDSETRGAAELLTKLLSARQNTIVIGSITKGLPFRLKQVVLDNGNGALYIPDPETPGARENWPPAPVKPDIVMPTELTPQALEETRKIEDMKERQQRDPVLRRAIDLLVMVRGLTRRGQGGGS